MKASLKRMFLASVAISTLATASFAQSAKEVRGTIIQIEQSEKEAIVMVDTQDSILLISNLTKFTAGELSLLKSSLEQAVPVKLKTQGNEIIAISSK